MNNDDVKQQSYQPNDDDSAGQTVASTTIKHPSMAARLTPHPPSTNIVGTPYPFDDKPFEYPFPDTSTSSSSSSSSHMPSSEHFLSLHHNSIGTKGPPSQSTSPPSLNHPRYLDPKKLSANLKLQPNSIIADLPVPPSLVAKRHRFDLDLAQSRGFRNSPTGDSCADFKNTSSTEAGGPATVQPPGNDPGNNGSACSFRGSQKSA